MLKLNPDVMCVEKTSRNIFLYNRINRKRYNISIRLKPIIEDAVTGVEVENHEEYKEEIAVLKKEGLLLEDVPFEALYRREIPGCGLKTIQLEITKKCNFSCVHCYLQDKKKAESLSLEEVKNIIEQASYLGLYNVDITGGEALTHSNIKEILEFIYRKGMRTTLFTNGYLINGEMIDFFKAIRLDCVKISVDSIDEIINDKIRKENSLSIILNNIEKLRNAGIRVQVTTVVMKSNLKEMDAIIDYFNERKDILHFIDSYVPLVKENDENLISENDYANILYNRLCGGKVNKLTKKNRYCGIAHDFLFIDSSGIAKLCPNMPDEFDIGSIKESNLLELWKVCLQNFGNMKCKKGDKCKHYSKCAGGCRNRALLFSGSINGEDTYMCKFYEMAELYKVW